MTSKERVLKRMQGQYVDKVPNLSITMLFAAQYAGIPYGEFCKDYKKLVEAQTRTAKDFGIDILSTMSDPLREFFDYGGSVLFQKDDLPIVREVFLKDMDDFPKLKTWNPSSSVRMLDRIKAIELFKTNEGNNYPILGWVEGALAEFSDLCGISEALVLLFEEPEYVKECMEIITEQAIKCAVAQIRAGADIIGIGDACASLISKELYIEFGLPYEQRIISKIHEEGGKAKLHICGNITHLLDEIVKTGADILDIDYMVDLEKAVNIAGEACCLCGNINPVETILQGGKKEIDIEIRTFLDRTNNRSFISSGCEIPRMSPQSNVYAINECINSYIKR